MQRYRSYTRRVPSDRAYGELLELRTRLRHFLHWSETQAQAAGLTPAQHQLLLAIRGHGDRRGPTIGQIADYLVLRHHSAVGLTDRAVAAGLVVRSHDDERPGTVRLSLTTLGSERLDALAASHMEELARLAPTMKALWRNEDSRFAPEGSRSVADENPRRSRDRARIRHDRAVLQAELRRMSTRYAVAASPETQTRGVELGGQSGES